MSSQIFLHITGNRTLWVPSHTARPTETKPVHVLESVTPNELSRSFYLFDYPIQVVDDARLAATSPSMKTPHEVMAAINDFRRVCAEDHNFFLQQCYKPNRPPAPSTSASSTQFNTPQSSLHNANTNLNTGSTTPSNTGNQANANLGDVLTQLLQQQQQQQQQGNQNSPGAPTQNSLMMPSNLYNSNTMSNLYGHADTTNSNTNNKGNANSYKNHAASGYGYQANNPVAAAAAPHINLPMAGPAYQATASSLSLPLPPPPPSVNSVLGSSNINNPAINNNNNNNSSNNAIAAPPFPFYQPGLAQPPMHNNPFGPPRSHGGNMPFNPHHSMPPYPNMMGQQNYGPFGGVMRNEPEPIEINVEIPPEVLASYLNPAQPLVCATMPGPRMTV